MIWETLMEIVDVETNVLSYNVAVDVVVDVIQRQQTTVDVTKIRTKQTLRKPNVKELMNNV